MIAACSSTTHDGGDGAADSAGEAVTAVQDCPLPDASAVAAVVYAVAGLRVATPLATEAVAVVRAAAETAGAMNMARLWNPAR